MNDNGDDEFARRVGESVDDYLKRLSDINRRLGEETMDLDFILSLSDDEFMARHARVVRGSHAYRDAMDLSVNYAPRKDEEELALFVDVVMPACRIAAFKQKLEPAEVAKGCFLLGLDHARTSGSDAVEAYVKYVERKVQLIKAQRGMV